MSRLFAARRRKTAATASEGSLPGQDRDSSSREWSRLEHLQSTPRSWREEDSVAQDRPLSSTPLTDKAAYPTTPDTGPSPFSPSVCVESDLSLADGSLVGGGEVAGGAVTRLHCRVHGAVQDLKVGGFTRPTRYHYSLLKPLICKHSLTFPCPQSVLWELDRVSSQETASGGTYCTHTSICVPLCNVHSDLTDLSSPSLATSPTFPLIWG